MHLPHAPSSNLGRCGGYERVGVAISTSNEHAEVERALHDDVVRVSTEFHAGEGGGGESPMIEVLLMSIAGEVFKVDISRDETVRQHCCSLLAHENNIVRLPTGSGSGTAREGGHACRRKGGVVL